MTERFTRIGVQETVYEFTVEDDKIYRQTWSGELTIRLGDGEIYECACHEGYYGLTGMVAGEREQGVGGLR